MYNGLNRRTPLTRKVKIRGRRTGTRRGELTPAQKARAREFIYELCCGMCELRLHPNCSKDRILPWDGSIFARWHLVHPRAKRRFGWPTSGPWRMRGGCYWCHRISLHEQGIRLEPLEGE